MKIAVIGAGVLGLTAALGFADQGFEVVGFDPSEERMAALKRGTVPFSEPDLDTALTRVHGKTFALAADEEDAATDADFVFLAVGTPAGTDGKADLSDLFAAIDSVIGAVDPDCVLVVKSAVPPGTTERALLPYLRAKGFQGSVATNPDFSREGCSWQDFMVPDRIVCGCDEGDRYAVERLTELYEPFEAPIQFVSFGTAEFIKSLSSSLLASLIGFSSEMARIAETVGGVDVARAFQVLHQDQRLKNAGINGYIDPGCVSGDASLRKDAVALAALARAAGETPRILNSVVALYSETT